MSQKKTTFFGRPTPLFLLSHGSSVPSGLHILAEKPPAVTETPSYPPQVNATDYKTSGWFIFPFSIINLLKGLILQNPLF